MKPKNLRPRFKLPADYIVLFIGAGDNYRKWDVENFVAIGKYVAINFRFAIVLCGGPADLGDAKKFREYFGSEYMDLVGKTSLSELLSVIYNARLIITNETGAPHCAAAVGTTSIVISNGNHYGRFTPYPDSMTNKYYAIYHPEIENNLKDHERMINRYGYGSKLDINDITVEALIRKVNEVMKISQSLKTSREKENETEGARL